MAHMVGTRKAQARRQPSLHVNAPMDFLGGGQINRPTHEDTRHKSKRREASSAGYPELEQVSRSKLHKILMQGELRPHKVRYYVERRDPEFESKMAAVLHVYK